MTPEKYLEFLNSVDAYSGSYYLSVSVVIPHYNSHRLLSRCIASLASQSYPSELMEIIISDDGSDSPPRVCDLAFAKKTELHILTQERCGFRAGAARNRAIEHASGDIILCLDADMIPVESFVEAHLRRFHVSPHIASIGPRKFIDIGEIAAQDIVSFRENFQSYPDIASVSNHYHPLDGRLPFLKQLYLEKSPYWFFYSCNVGFSRSDALSVSLFDEWFDGHWGYEDIEFAYRLFRSGCTFIYVPEALAFHQENIVTTCDKREDDGQINFIKLISKWPELIDEEPNTIP